MVPTILMMDNFGFGSYFGLDLPKEEKEEKTNKKVTGKKTNSKKTDSSKNKEKIYKAPIKVHTEWGDITVSEIEDLSISEISKKMVNSEKLEITEKSGELFAYFKTGLNEKEESFKEDDVTVYVAGELMEVENCSSINELKKAVNSNYPELEDVEYTLKRIDKNDNCFILRLINSVDLSLKLSGDIRIGFLGNYEKIQLAEPKTLKEVATDFEKSYSWLSKIEIDWFWCESSRTIIAQFAKTKAVTKELIVKLPVCIRFLHDAGELSNGLTPDMFDGKEYVSTKEILKVVDKVFPDVYSEKNSQVTYIEPVNTVCVMRQGRSKGCTNAIGTYNSYTEKYNFFLPKIPYSILEEIICFFKEELPKEALVNIVYDSENGKYSIVKPVAVTTETRVFWDECSVLAQLKPTQSVVCEIHSHNRMHAFFSGVDDRDEIQPLLYGVIGKLHDITEIIFRARIGKNFYPVLVKDIFK